jgi:alpha-tubulin suppressor-like RCC1 family protein
VLFCSACCCSIGDTEVPAAYTVNLGAHTAAAVAAGQDFTCAILDDSSVKCWGLNFLTAGVTTEYGQLGTGNQDNLLMPSSTPVDLGSGRTAKAIAAGRAHVCVVSAAFALKNIRIQCVKQAVQVIASCLKRPTACEQAVLS